ncbi:DUF488 family protein [bacterium]|nr:DUF488 family protein [bacterium]
MDANKESLKPLLELIEKVNRAFLYAAKDEERNNAVALKTYLEHKLSE